MGLAASRGGRRPPGEPCRQSRLSVPRLKPRLGSAAEAALGSARLRGLLLARFSPRRSCVYCATAYAAAHSESDLSVLFTKSSTTLLLVLMR